MPKNKGKGGKNWRKGRNHAHDENQDELVHKEDGQEYAQVKQMLGGARCLAKCIDGKERLCHIRRTMQKKSWIYADDIILVGLRDFEEDKADVILKYTTDQARLLMAGGQLPRNIRLNEGIAGRLDEDDADNNDHVVFGEPDINNI